MFGRPFRIPTDMLYGYIEDSKFYSLKDFQDNMRCMYELAKRSTNTSQTKMKHFYDKHRTEDELDIGDYVYVY